MVAIGSRIAIVEVEPVFPAQATTRDDCPFGVGQIPSLMELRRAIRVPGDSGSHQPKLVTVVSTGAAGTASSRYFSAPPNTISDRRNKKLNLRLSRLGWGRPMRDGAVSLCSIRLSAKDVVSLLLVADHVIGVAGRGVLWRLVRTDTGRHRSHRPVDIAVTEKGEGVALAARTVRRTVRRGEEIIVGPAL